MKTQIAILTREHNLIQFFDLILFDSIFNLQYQKNNLIKIISHFHKISIVKIINLDFIVIIKAMSIIKMIIHQFDDLHSFWDYYFYNLKIIIVQIIQYKGIY